MSEKTETKKTESKKTYKFKAEIKQLLDILAKSLYTNREVFVRELISNATDALDKVRFENIRGTEIFQPDVDFEIKIDLDKEKKLFTITDTGIGMTKDELISNIGTIAHSGSMDFLKKMSENEDKGPDLIGQFGVGFYSVFMAADDVVVTTRSFLKDESSWQWSSDGSGSYKIEQINENIPRGTKIEVHLKDDAEEFSEKFRIESVIKTYSNFVSFPIKLDGEQVNKISAIWREPKSSVKEKEYKEFYKFFANASEDPVSWMHFSADAPIQLNSLLFFPKMNYETLGFSPEEHGVSLFVKRVLIQNDNKDLMPKYLRFVRGVVDTEDLPLNISRETLQENAVVIKIRNLLVKRILAHLSEMAKNETDKYNEFWNQFGRILKEGYADYANQEKVASLFRYNSSSLEKSDELCSLDDYVERMKEGQQNIFYLSTTSRDAANKNPHLEIFRKKGIEVLYSFDPIDEFVLSGLMKYKEKQVVSADQADVDSLKDVKAGEETDEKTDDKKKAVKPDEKDLEKLCTRIKNILGDQIEEVRLSERLTDSPAVLVSADGGMSAQMSRIMQVMNKDAPSAKKIMEINGDHELVKNMLTMYKKNPKDKYLSSYVDQLFQVLMLQDGFLVDPHKMVSGIQSLLKDASSWYLKEKKEKEK
jgi:molecular chaperone HtpG